MDICDKKFNITTLNMEKLKIGIIGLGRLGVKYAINIKKHITNAELTAVSSIRNEELELAANQLDVKYTFHNHQDLLLLNELDAVFVLSSSDQHAEHIIHSLDAGLHVFSEKPLALNVSDCQRIINAADRKPNQHCHVGFVRRWDSSYRRAKALIEQGKIGEVIMVRSQTVDKDAGAEGLKYSKTSGGLFLDYNVHDIDLARWYIGSEVDTVYSTGGAYKHPALKDDNDADHAITICKFKNGKIAELLASRIGSHGHDTYTEVIGTEGSLRIGRPASVDRLEIYDNSGIRRETVQNFYERFEDAFLAQTQGFIDDVVAGKKSDSSLVNGLEATRVAVAMTKSFLMGREVLIDR